jgi:hypothetical protein
MIDLLIIGGIASLVSFTAVMVDVQRVRPDRSPPTPPPFTPAKLVLHVTRWQDSLPSLPIHPWGWRVGLDDHGIPVAMGWTGVQHRYCTRLKGWVAPRSV